MNGSTGEELSAPTVDELIAGGLERVDLDGRSLCVLVPDSTRTCPLPALLGAVHSAVSGRVSRATVVVALGTHAPTSAEERRRLVRSSTGDWPVVDHEWWDESTFVTLGHISAERVADLSGGRLHRGVDVRVNRAVVDHDVTLVVGPVLPHEVVGFSGGNKYLFPGVSSPEMIDLSHWLGALVTSAEIIGTTGVTPVRALIDEAAGMVPSQRVAVCVVCSREDGRDLVHAVEVGPPEEAWARAAAVAARTHIRYLDRPVQRVLSVVPERYRDLWTGAKGFYKVEPVVADGGEVVLYAPHIADVSVVHPEVEAVGYHCRDYFLGQWDRFSSLPWGVIAHSTHLRGAGTWDPLEGERPRVKVTLATAIPEATTRAVGLDWADPAGIDVEAWRSDGDALVVPDAGEVLYRLA